MTSCIIQDGSLHVCIFNKDFLRLTSYFKNEILVKGCSPNELSINRLKKDCHFGVNFLYSSELHQVMAGRGVKINSLLLKLLQKIQPVEHSLHEVLSKCEEFKQN